MILGLLAAVRLGAKRLIVKGDSMLVIQQVSVKEITRQTDVEAAVSGTPYLLCSLLLCLWWLWLLPHGHNLVRDYGVEEKRKKWKTP